MNGCTLPPGHTWALCGRSCSIPSSSSRRVACSSPTEATCACSSNVSYFTFGKKCSSWTRAAFYDICVKHQRRAGFIAALHFPFRNTRRPRLLFPMRSRCGSDVGGLNGFIMRAAHLEGPPTHRARKEPRRRETQHCWSASAAAWPLICRWIRGRIDSHIPTWCQEHSQVVVWLQWRIPAQSGL